MVFLFPKLDSNSCSCPTDTLILWGQSELCWQGQTGVTSVTLPEPEVQVSKSHCPAAALPTIKK